MAENKLFLSENTKTFRNSQKLDTLDKVKNVWNNINEPSEGKPVKFSWRSLWNATKELGIGIALSTPQMQVLGELQTAKQKKEGIEPTWENNLKERRLKRWNELKEENVEANEKDYIDAIEDYEKGLYKAAQSIQWNIGDLITAGIDLGPGRLWESELNQELTEHMEANRIADPETLVGDALEIVTEYGVPGSAVFKIAGRLRKLDSVRKKAAQFTGAMTTVAGAKWGTRISNVATKVGGSAGSFGAIEFLASTPDREVGFVTKIDTEGLSGKALALANLKNRLRFGLEGTLFGAGFALAGKPIAQGFKYGIFKPLFSGYGAPGTLLNKFSVAKIGLKGINSLVVNPLTRLASGSTKEYAEWLAKKTGAGKTAEKLMSAPFKTYDKFAEKTIYPITKKGVEGIQYGVGEILPKTYLALANPVKVLSKELKIPIKKRLPSFGEWRNYGLQDRDPLKVALKNLDNKLEMFRSIGKMTGGQYEITDRVAKEIKAKQRTVDKWLDSLEYTAKQLSKENPFDKAVTKLANKFKNQYDSNTTSPASMEKYLDDVLAFLKNQKPLKALRLELREAAQGLKKELGSLNKNYGNLLPRGELRDAIISTVNPYLRQSFAIFSNPYFKPTDEVKNKAIKYLANMISKDKTLRLDAHKLYGGKGIPPKMVYENNARTLVDEILHTGRTDGRDPLKIINYIAQNTLHKPDLVIKTGRELPTEIKALLGEELNLKSAVLTTANQAIVNTTNKIKGDALAKLGLDEGWLFESKAAALAAGKRDVAPILKDTKSTLKGFDIENNLQRSIIPKKALWADAEYAAAVNGMPYGKIQQGLNAMVQSTAWRNLLQFKVATQYGKTVLSPATQVRNVTSASMFSLASGHIGGRASVTEAFKMIADDIFGAGKIINEEAFIKNLERKVQLGVIDENIIASEMKAVLQDIKAGARMDNGKITSMQRLIDKVSSKKWLRDTGRTATRIYAGGDNLWKWYGHEYVMSQYKQIFKNMDDVARWYDEIAGFKFDKINPFTGKQKTLLEGIEEAAAWNIKNTYPTYSKVPEIIKLIRKVPFFGNFVSFPAEMTRTSFNLVDIGMKEVASSNALIRQMGYRRLLGTYFVMGGASTGALKLATTLTGVSEEQLDAYKESFAPAWNKYSVIIPVDKWEGGIGKAINFSYFSPYDVVQQPIETFFGQMKYNKKLKGEFDPFASAVQAVGTYMKPYMSEAIAIERLNDVLPAGWITGGRSGLTKTGSRVYSITDDGETAFWKSVAHIAQGVEPGAFTTGKKIFKGAFGELNNAGEPYDLSDELTALFSGVRIIPINIPKSMQYKINEYQKNLKAVDDTEDFYKSAGFKTEGRIGQTLVEEFKNIQKEYFDQQQKMYFVIQDALKTGVEEDEIEEILEQRLPRKDVWRLMEGEFKPWKYSTKRFEKRIEEIEALYEDTDAVLNDDAIFPQMEFDEVMDDLEDKRLDMPWYKDQMFEELGKKETETETVKTAALPKVFEKFLTAKKPVVKYNVPVETTPVSQEVVQTAASNVNINPETGLTRIDDALLSREEKAMRLRQKGMTA